MTLPTTDELQWLGAILGGIVAAFKTARPLARMSARAWRSNPIRRHFAGVSQMVADVGAMRGEISEIRRRVEGELGPNGGGSMKDQVTVIAARQAAIFDSMSRPAFQADAAGKFVSVNRAFEAMTGYPARDLLEMGWVNLIHQDEVEEFMIAWHHAIEDGRILRRACAIVTASDVQLAVCVDAIPVKVGQRVIEWQGTFERPEAA